MNKIIITLILPLILLSSLTTLCLSEDSITNKSKVKIKRGLITSSTCPYSCKDEGLSKKECKDWQKGTRCYVEDYTQAPGHRTRVAVKNTRPRKH